MFDGELDELDFDDEDVKDAVVTVLAVFYAAGFHTIVRNLLGMHGWFLVSIGKGMLLWQLRRKLSAFSWLVMVPAFLAWLLATLDVDLLVALEV